MAIWVDCLQATAAIGTLVYGYVRLSTKRRSEVRTLTFRWGGYIGSAIVGFASIMQIIKFGSSDEVLTRKDVLWLLLNIWNAVAYIGCGLALAAIFHREDKAKLAARPE